MHKLFVESKAHQPGRFRSVLACADLSARRRAPSSSRSSKCWPTKAFLPVEKSLKLLSDKSRFAYLPLELYDIDIELARAFRRRPASAGVCCPSIG